MANLKSNITRMYVFRFLLSMHFIGGVLVPFMTDWGHISFTQIMLLQSFFMISIFALEVPTGAIADYLGRRTTIIISAIINGVAALVYSSYPSFYVFMVGEFLWALAHALLSGADEALVYDSLKSEGMERESKRIFGRITSSTLAALMVSAPIGSIIAATLGLRYTMMFLSAPCFLAAVVGIGFTEPECGMEERGRDYLGTIRSGMAYFRDHRALKILAFDSIAVGNMVYMLIWAYQPILRELNVPIFYFGFVQSAMTAIQIVFLNNFGRIEGILGSKKRYVVFSAIVPGIALIALSANYHISSTVILILVISGLGFTRSVLFQSYFNKFIESDNRATVLSTISMLSVFVRAVTYPLFGMLVEWSLRNAIFIIGALTMLFTALSRVREEHLVD
ncbi:MAG: MFS transporter [Candidatus Methanofastidiosa archaeon]|nr:MFS transporter [Candidatus Methanofastidiosa archaeon]